MNLLHLGVVVIFALTTNQPALTTSRLSAEAPSFNRCGGAVIPPEDHDLTRERSSVSERIRMQKKRFGCVLLLAALPALESAQVAGVALDPKPVLVNGDA
jgi:hypothetical protein